MKTAICYYSRHHGNTLKLLKAMAGEETDLIDVTSRMAVNLEDYDAVGFASGIYYGRFHDTVVDFSREYLEVPSESPEYQWFCSSFKRSLHHYYTIF
jgi:menaquinone-dependent protoporphyrinogen IX oxidase